MNKEFTYEVTTSPREKFGKSRVFVWGAPEPEMILPAPKERGVDPENDKAYDRYNRSLVRIQKAHLIAAMEAGLIPGDERMTARFSRKAGCSCSCSPGFILEDAWGLVDYHLTITTVEATTEAPSELVSKKLAAIKG